MGTPGIDFGVTLAGEYEVESPARAFVAISVNKQKKVMIVLNFMKLSINHR